MSATWPASGCANSARSVKAGYTITNEFDLKGRRDRSLKHVLFDLVPEAKVYMERLLTRLAYNFALVVYHDMLPGAALCGTQRTVASWMWCTNVAKELYQPEVTAVAKEYCALVESSGENNKAVEEFAERRKTQRLETLDVRFVAQFLFLSPISPKPMHSLFLTQSLKFHFAVARWDYNHHRTQADGRLKALQARKAAYVTRLRDPTLHLPRRAPYPPRKDRETTKRPGYEPAD
ncbi:hypothetical protein LXA43DRAFT_607143 [Ganoderma leucocontextum]|nr:hypothetical protein LXA43DRAFT_607143 [Ganoderma leucocontextum]